MTGTDMEEYSRSLKKFPLTRRNFRSEFGARTEAYHLPTLQQNDIRPDARHDGGAHGDVREGLQPLPFIDGRVQLPQIRGFDEADGLPITIERKAYRWYDLLINLVSIFSFIFDVGSDIYLCLTYYREREYLNFWLTLAFIAVPSLTMTCFSLRWYVKDYLDNQKFSQGKYEVSCIRWFIRCFGLILQLGPVMRYADAIYYGVQTWRARGLSQEYYYTQMLFEDADSCLLRLIECTMESGPQLVLQLYIMATQGTDENQFRLLIQTTSCCLSLISLAWSVTSYTRALRYSRDDKRNMGLASLPVHFLWHLFMTGPRVIALAMFAVQFTYWIFVLVALHWFVMTAWLVKQQTHFTGTVWEEIPFNAVVGVIYILCYLNVKEGRTRHKYTLYYVLTYLENAGMIVSWYFLQRETLSWYHLPALLTVLVSTFAGLLFMQIYYFCCHPTGEIQVCLSDTASTEPQSPSELNEEGPREDREVGRAHFADEAVLARPVQNHRAPDPAVVNQNQNNNVRDCPDARMNHVPYQQAATINAQMMFRQSNNSSPFAFRKTDEQMGNIEIGPPIDRFVESGHRPRGQSPAVYRPNIRDVYGSHSPQPQPHHEYQSCTVPRSLTYHARDPRDPRACQTRDPRDPRAHVMEVSGRDPRLLRDPRDIEPRDVREPRAYPRVGNVRDCDVRIPRDEYGMPLDHLTTRQPVHRQNSQPRDHYESHVDYDPRYKPPWNQRISQQFEDNDHARGGSYCDNRADNGTRV